MIWRHDRKEKKRPLTLSRALILKEDEIYQYFSIEGADNENTEVSDIESENITEGNISGDDSSENMTDASENISENTEEFSEISEEDNNNSMTDAENGGFSAGNSNSLEESIQE